VTAFVVVVSGPAPVLAQEKGEVALRFLEVLRIERSKDRVRSNPVVEACHEAVEERLTSDPIEDRFHPSDGRRTQCSWRRIPTGLQTTRERRWGRVGRPLEGRRLSGRTPSMALSVIDHAYSMEKGEIAFDSEAHDLLDRSDLLRSVFVQGGHKGPPLTTIITEMSGLRHEARASSVPCGRAASPHRFTRWGWRRQPSTFPRG